MDGNLKLSEPLAFIVHVPDSLQACDLQTACERVMAIERAAVQMGLVPYVETYSRILLDDTALPEVEIRLRLENIRMLRAGMFEAIHISGARTSSYVRNILYWAFHTSVDVYCMPTPDSLLEKYLRMCTR